MTKGVPPVDLLASGSAIPHSLFLDHDSLIGINPYVTRDSDGQEAGLTIMTCLPRVREFDRGDLGFALDSDGSRLMGMVSVIQYGLNSLLFSCPEMITWPQKPLTPGTATPEKEDTGP